MSSSQCNTYRIDRVSKQIDPTSYKVPCGMNSIIYISKYKQQENFLPLCKKKDDEVFLCSEWDDREARYVIYDYWF